MHGRLDLYEKIKEYIKPEDNVFFLGDAIDRGPHGVEIMLDILKQNNWIYLKGNHEDMMVKVCLEYLEGINYNVPLWMQNGGNQTLEDFLKFPEQYQRFLLSKLASLQEVSIYKNAQGQIIHLSHAGGMIRDIMSDDTIHLDFLWDRYHFYENFESDYDKKLYVVHGHTPTQILNEKIAGNYSNNEIRIYCNGHKIDIDTGCFASKQIALLDLDTLEPIYFRLEEGNEWN